MNKYTVGITCGLMYPDPNRNLFRPKTIQYTESQMMEWFLSLGIFPTILPRMSEEAWIEEYLNRVDALVLFGGTDVCPASYGETPLDPAWMGDKERDAYEIDLIQRAEKKGMPIFGICRGLQILNVAFGGTMYQDITTQLDDVLIHRDADIYDNNYHGVVIEPGGYLDELYMNSEHKFINSIHHQSIKDVAPGFRIDARCAEDNVIEAISHTDPDKAIFAVQWHPEWMFFHKNKGLDPSHLLMYLKSKIDIYKNRNEA